MRLLVNSKLQKELLGDGHGDRGRTGGVQVMEIEVTFRGGVVGIDIDGKSLGAEWV